MDAAHEELNQSTQRAENMPATKSEISQSQSLPELNQRIPLRVAAKLVPSTVNPGEYDSISYTTIRRWALKGSRGVVLRTVTDPTGTRYTTRQWLIDFVESLGGETQLGGGDTQADPQADAKAYDAPGGDV